MTGKKGRSYKNKCGSCVFFAFHTKHKDTRENGHCENTERAGYHQASQKACKLYKEGVSECIT